MVDEREMKRKITHNDSLNSKNRKKMQPSPT